MGNIYDEIDALVAELRSVGRVAWADRIALAVRAGATGSEILMGVRWNVQQLVSAEGESLPADTRLHASEVIAATTSLLR